MGDYKRLRTITADWKKVIDRYKRKYEQEGCDISALIYIYRYCYQAMAIAEMGIGHLDDAEVLLREAEKLTKGCFPVA